MSNKLEAGKIVTLHLKDRRGTIKHRYGTVIHISATTILLELTMNQNIYEGDILNGNYNYRFDEIVRIDIQ